MKRHTKVLQFKVIIEQDEGGLFVASVPELPGCYTQGKTLEQVRERVKEVIELVLESDEDVKKEKLSSPQPHSKFFSGESIGVGLLRKILRDVNLTPGQFSKLR